MKHTLALVLMVFTSFGVSLQAHGGNTNSDNCHKNNRFNEYHCHNQHDDCNDDDHALKIQRGQERIGTLIVVVHCGWFRFGWFGSVQLFNIHCVAFLFIYNLVYSNIKHIEHISCNMLNIERF